ncbi:probable multidrug resistance-associated protein lethal(2)03659 isoform X1 [Zophobas morio]|uniref:probable multidrug resistance-associated protein lethal(2)03659 isoform X1 n=1 Tax=Zophobas morio TaxID=2755281 RepID=UPI0030827B08
MNSEKRQKQQANPRQLANVLSKITFWYTRELFIKGFNRELEQEDLYEVLPEFDTNSLGDRITHEWTLHKHRKNDAMFSIFWKMFGKHYLLLGLTKIIHIISDVLRPILIGRLVYFFTSDQTELTKQDAYMYSFFLIGLQIFNVFYRHNYYFVVETLAIKVRTAICALIYRKCLKLPGNRLRDISFAKITNLITRDIHMFVLFFVQFNEGWTGFSASVIIFCNLYRDIGLPAIVVLILFGVFIPFQVYCGIRLYFLKKSTSEKTDKRIEALQGALSSIKSVKMFVWEKFVERQIIFSRRKEMSALMKILNILFFTVVAGMITSNVAFYFVVMIYVWSGKPLMAETMYIITGAFLNFSFILATAVPYAIFYFSQIFAAIKRMQLVVQQLDHQSEEKNNKDETNDPKIHLKNVTVKQNDKSLFQDVNLMIEKGLTIITGLTNSGKSIFLMSLLQEFELSNGNIETQDSM